MTRALLIAALALAGAGCESRNYGCPRGVWAVSLHSEKAADTKGDWMRGVTRDTTGATELRTLGWRCRPGSWSGYWCCTPPAEVTR